MITFKVYVIFLLDIWMKREMNLFIDVNIKIKLQFFSNDKLKFKLEHSS